MDVNNAPRSFWQRLYGLIEAGFEVMARYPYDMTELSWNSDLFGKPDDDESPGEDGPEPPAKPPGGRAIKVIPSPAMQRYQAARPSRLTIRPMRKQPV